MKNKILIRIAAWFFLVGGLICQLAGLEIELKIGGEEVLAPRV